MRLGLRSFYEGNQGTTKTDLVEIGKKVAHSTDRKSKTGMLLPLVRNPSISARDLVENIPLLDLKQAGMSPRKMLNALIEIENSKNLGKAKIPKGQVMSDSSNDYTSVYQKIAEIYAPDELAAHGFPHAERELIYHSIKRDNEEKKEPTMKLIKQEVKHYID